MCSPSRLLGKRALITGAGTGIGREVALEFARQGADIALHYSHDDSGAKSAAEEISRMGRKAGLTDQAVLDFGTNSIPVARIGAPLDIAKVACFLCSDDAEYIVGQTIIVDGGTSALMSIVHDFRTESGNKFGSGYLPGV